MVYGECGVSLQHDCAVEAGHNPPQEHPGVVSHCLVVDCVAALVRLLEHASRRSRRLGLAPGKVRNGVQVQDLVVHLRVVMNTDQEY